MNTTLRDKSYKICIIFPFDPSSIGASGVCSFIKGFIKYAPHNFEIEVIGITSDKIERPVKKWQRLQIGEREFVFFPLFFEKDENRKTLIPLSLRFTAALKFSGLNFSNRVLNFHRIEPALLFRNLKHPKISFVHTDIQQQLDRQKSEVLWKYLPTIYKWIESRIIKSFDYIYVINKNTLELYQSQYPEQNHKFGFLPTWVDREIFYPKDEVKEKIRQEILRINKQLPERRKWILFVGRLQEAKAPLRLIQVFAEYHKISKENCLLIIGEGNLEQKVKNYIAELGLERSIYFLGSKNQLELAEYYRAADVLLLTSNFEGMPMSVLEALGCGLPVVTTDVGEVKRVVINGYSGEMVKSFSPKDIVLAIEKIINNPESYTKENCVSSVKEYTPQKVLTPLYEMMRKLYIEKVIQK